LDVKYEAPYKLITWKIDRAILSPVVGLDIHQGWPYAPYHAMIVGLPYINRALILFLALTVLTLVICGAPVRLWQIALLAGIFTLPVLVLMAGGVPLPSSISPAQFAAYQIRILPVLALIPLFMSCLVLRNLPRFPLVLVLCLMIVFLCGYPQISLLADEQKRNSLFGVVQVGMIAYIFSLSLYMRVRKPVFNMPG
jgi:hypothetical protein